MRGVRIEYKTWHCENIKLSKPINEKRKATFSRLILHIQLELKKGEKIISLAKPSKMIIALPHTKVKQQDKLKSFNN